jgi:hypothetical protein
MNFLSVSFAMNTSPSFIERTDITMDSQVEAILHAMNVILFYFVIASVESRWKLITRSKRVTGEVITLIMLLHYVLSVMLKFTCITTDTHEEGSII